MGAPAAAAAPAAALVRSPLGAAGVGALAGVLAGVAAVADADAGVVADEDVAAAEGWEDAAAPEGGSRFDLRKAYVAAR